MTPPSGDVVQGIAILLWAADPSVPERLATPFFHAAAAAALDVPVEIYFTAASVRLLVPGVAAGLHASAHHAKTIYDNMREAVAHGARQRGQARHAGGRVVQVLDHLVQLAAPRLPPPLWQGLLQHMEGEQRLLLRGACVHLPEHGAQLSASEQRIAQKVAPALAQAGFEGAWARDLARDAQESEPLMRATLARQVGAAHDGVVLAAQFRDATGLGRKRAIQVLEHFDRIGLTRRIGDEHRLRLDSALFLDPVP